MLPPNWTPKVVAIDIDGTITDENKKLHTEAVKALRRLEQAGIPDLQIKDLRKFLNSVLVNDCGLSHKEAGLHIGNTNMVNYNHYTQVDFESIKTKLEKSQYLLPQFLN